MKRATTSAALLKLWSAPPLPVDVRERVAAEAVRLVIGPGLCLSAFAVVAVLLTIGLSEPTRLVPLGVFVAACGGVAWLGRVGRWLAAAGLLCAAGVLLVVGAVALNSVHAPAYSLGVLVLMLIVTLFGLRWAAAAALAFVSAGALWLSLDAHGLTTGVKYPSSALVFCLYVGIFLLTLAWVGGPQQLLREALRDARKERELAEQARSAEANSELAFHAVFDQAGVALALLSPDGRIVQLNPRAADLLEQREAAGLLLTAAVRWSEAERQWLQHALGEAAQGRVSRRELSSAVTGKSPLVLQVSLSPFVAPSGRVQYVLLEMVDVSDLIETRTMLEQARRLEALGKLSGGVAHDLNNMLAAIMCGSELVKIARGDVRKIDEHVKLIESSVQRASTLTKQLLAFGRKDRWNSEQLDMKRLVFEVARLLERTLRKNIDLVLTNCDESCFVRADSAAIEHALLNLALNAQDAMPDGGTLTISCLRRTLDAAACERLGREIEPGPCAVLRVEDTGTGMSAEIQAHILEPFFTTKGPSEGAGLGLAAVHGTMRAHHGAIAVSSQLGVGTRVELLFPALSAADLVRPLELPEQVVPARLAARVLLADDEPFARSAIAAILVSAGCEVHALGDGTALIEALAEDRTSDLIVSDLAMPGLGGVELVQAIEALRPELPLLLITGFTGEDVANACVPRASRRLLRKPFLRAELLRTCTDLLAQAPRKPRALALEA